MERASAAAFAAQPVGRCTAGRSWVHFCAHPTLFGVVLFGRPDRDDIEALVRSLVVELGDGVPPHRSLVDAQRVTGIDGGAFEALHGYVRRHHAALRAQVERLALVRPEGLEGAVVAGFYGVLEPPYPVSLFDDATAALAWLDEPAPTLVEALARTIEELRGLPPIVAALRALLAADLALAPEDACRALALSARTLQRRLQEAGTSFGKELLAARLAAAERRMLAGDDPLTAIALDVGFASLQHFSTLFREATGETPSAWRARRRG